MKLRITIEEIETGATEDVFANVPVVRRWEEKHGEPIGPKLEAGYVGPISELAHLAYMRKHGKTESVLSLDEFEDRFEPTEFDAGGRPGTDPSDPATAPQ